MVADITFYDVSEDQHPLLRRALNNYPFWDARLVEEPLSLKNTVLAEKSAAISIFTDSPITLGILERLPALRLVATRSSGVDHIDLAAAQHRVTVCNVPHYGEIAKAEYAFGLLIALMRRLSPTLKRCFNGNFSRIGLTGQNLHGKTLGIIGTGPVGMRVARFAHAFGMRILAWDPQPNTQLSQDYGVDYLDLDTLLPQVDALSLHLPYTTPLHHLLDEARLRLLKAGAVLVNTARGGLIDSRALARLQAEGHFGGLALDRFEGEMVWLHAQAPLPRDLTSTQFEQALHSFQLQLGENVLLTPHNAFNTTETLELSLSTTIENIGGFFAGQPQNVVKFERESPLE